LGQNSSLYLTLSRHGIWYYQRCLPSNLRRSHPQQKNLSRASLRTNNKGDANRLSRLLSVNIDSIVQELVDCPEKLFDALDTLRSNLIKGISPAVPSMTNGLMGRTEAKYQDAIDAELRRFREGTNKLLTKFSELLETVPVKNQSATSPTITDDDNPVENAIGPFAVGRKNWLFSASVPGAKASANLYSLLETAKDNGLEPYAYLKAGVR